MQTIRLEFRDLSPEQARKLIDTYEAMQRAPAMEPGTAEPLPVPAAPPAHPAPPAATGETAGPEKDVRGVPHNPALHAPIAGERRGRLKTGAWKPKKGANALELQKYEAEFLTPVVMAPAIAEIPDDPEPGDSATPPAPAGNVTDAAPAIAKEIAAAMPAPVYPEDDDPGEQAILNKARELAQAGKLPSPVVAGLMARVNVTNLDGLTSTPEIRRTVWAELEKIAA